jgi:hypothetical protein
MVMMAFLPEEIATLQDLVNEADALFSGDQNYFMSLKHYDDVFRLMVDVKEKYNIVGNPTAMMKIIST